MLISVDRSSTLIEHPLLENAEQVYRLRLSPDITWAYLTRPATILRLALATMYT
jgi:hypothetical protein